MLQMLVSSQDQVLIQPSKPSNDNDDDESDEEDVEPPLREILESLTKVSTYSKKMDSPPTF